VIGMSENEMGSGTIYASLSGQARALFRHKFGLRWRLTLGDPWKLFYAADILPVGAREGARQNCNRQSTAVFSR